MPRRFIRLLLVLVLLLSSEVWALGLGEVRLNSALNQPLRAEIKLLGATPEELANLTVALASASTFRRYGIDRPFYLQDMVFDIVTSGQAEGNYVRIRSASPITEPFLTFLVEASWSRGRLLREYTVLLDPPTFAPPSIAQSQPVVTAPQRSSTTDSGRIDREPVPQEAPTPTPASQFRPSPHRPLPESAPDDTPYDTAEGGGYIVERGETLWGIATAMRPDRRLTMNQTMLAIFEANPQAFQGNINILSAGASLRLPSADDIYRIDRGEALSEVQRQHYAWGGVTPPPPTTSEPFVAPDTQPSLTLVPPDEEPIGLDTGIETDFGDEPMTREQEVLDRIAELEAADVPIQHTLLEIRDNELAALRAELAEIHGEVYEPPIDDAVVDDEFVDDVAADDTVDDATDVEPVPVVDATDTSATQGPGSVLLDDSGWLPSADELLGWVTSIWAIIAGAVLAVIGLLIWFLRRGKDDEDESGAWDALDADEVRIDPLEATASIQAASVDESIVVVEQDSAITPLDEDTVITPAQAPAEADPTVVMTGIGDAAEAADETSQFDSLEDTFSSETAVNLDQSDPIAEADFHMAYGLYDQAADLINGALQVDPEGQALLTKLCEIYFVWGNRDAFIDAADRLKAAVGGGGSADWDKIVIMGQQIAGDHELFAGAGAGLATQEVDLSFESDATGAGELDMEFGADDGGGDIIDLGADDDSAQGGDEGLNFLFDGDAAQDTETSEDADASGDFDVTAEMPKIDAAANEVTAEMPSASPTVETPTIEEQFAGFDPTSELPTIDDSTLGSAIEQSGHASDATAEINLDDLDLNIDGLAETEMASLDEFDAADGDESLADTDVYDDSDEITDVTGKNPEVDPEVTGVQTTLDEGALELAESLKIEEEDLTATAEMRLAPDETGVNPMLNIALTDDAGDLSDNDATLLATGLDDDDDFDFAKTEALTPEVFTDNTNLDATGEMPAMSNTDVDLDLDELTAALKIGEQGDTLDEVRDDATVEYPLSSMSEDEVTKTMTLGASELSDELQEARTMTEVGTKLDLARAYVDMGDPAGARSILDEVLDEGDESQRQQAQSLLESLPT